MAINLKQVCFYYPEQPTQTILNIPNWSLATGERVFIHGSSGSGKSTLLNLLSGLHLPSTGQVEVLGQRLDQMSRWQRDTFRANHIGYVFQQFNLIAYLSAIDNLQLVQQFSLSKKITISKTTPQDLLGALNITESDWYKPTGTLSIGQQQRVAIARALINKPQLLIADEPTSSLDTVNKTAFMALLMSMMTDNPMTFVFVSHDLSLARYFNRVEPLGDINQLQRSI